RRADSGWPGQQVSGRAIFTCWHSIYSLMARGVVVSSSLVKRVGSGTGKARLQPTSAPARMARYNLLAPLRHAFPDECQLPVAFETMTEGVPGCRERPDESREQ